MAPASFGALRSLLTPGGSLILDVIHLCEAAADQVIDDLRVTVDYWRRAPKWQS